MKLFKGHILGLLPCLAVVVVSASALSSCSTTRVLEEGEYRLAKNKVIVTNDKKFNTKEVSQYIKQQPKGFSPLLYVYNWSGTDADSGIRRFFRRVGVAPVVYQSDNVNSSVENIKKHLEYIGYYGSQVSSEVKLNKKNVTVDYTVTLGKRYPIGNLSFVVPERGTFKEDFMADTVNVTSRPGVYLSESLLENESERSASAMRGKGYYGFTKNYYFFEADTLSHRDTAYLTMTVNEFTRNQTQDDAAPISKYRIGDVSISYPSTLDFRQKVLRGVNLITPGSEYDEAVINTTYNRFSSLKTFSGVNIGLTARDSSKVDCAILLTQSKLQSFKVVLEASSNSSGLIGISPQLTYSHKNVFRGGERLNLSFMGNYQFKIKEDVRSIEFGTSAGLSFPKVFGIPYSKFKKSSIPRSEVNTSYNYQNRPEYTRHILSLSLGISGNASNRFYYQVYPLQTNVVNLQNMDPDFYNTLSNNPFLRYSYQDHFDHGSGATLYYTTNSDVIPMTPYHYLRLSTDVSGNAVSLFNGVMRTNGDGVRKIFGVPYTQYVRAEFQAGRTFRFGKQDKFSAAFRFLAGAGYAYGNSSTLPFEKQFYAGGANSLRGWQARSVGPGNSQVSTTFSIPSQTGDMKLEANFEYRFPLVWKLEGAIFADAGNVWTLQDDMAGSDSSDKSNFTFANLPETIAADCGIGLRVNLTFILLRFDLGQKLHDPSLPYGLRWYSPDKWMSKNSFALHFGVGYPF